MQLIATPPRAVFFDLDETLIDNRRPVAELFREVFATLLPEAVGERGLAPDIALALREEVTKLWPAMFDRRDEDLLATVFARSLARSGVDCGDGLALRMARLLEELAAQAAALRDGASELLDYLGDAPVAVGIITNGIERLQMAKIERLDLTRRVDHVVVSEAAGAHKPDARVFGYALSKLEVDAAQAWHIGDHPLNDVSGAIASGMRAILYAPEDSDSARYASCEGQTLLEPHFRAAQLQDVLALLKKTGLG